jgi:hypothetical protein
MKTLGISFNVYKLYEREFATQISSKPRAQPALKKSQNWLSFQVQQKKSHVNSARNAASKKLSAQGFPEQSPTSVLTLP